MWGKTEGFGAIGQPGAGQKGRRQGCMRREWTLEAAPEAVRQVVGGGCQSGWGRLLSVTKPALAVRETVAGHRLGALEGGGYLPLPMHL